MKELKAVEPVEVFMPKQNPFWKHHTTFNKIPIRGNFSFDPASPLLAYGQGLYVKNGTKTFAAPYPRRASIAKMGDPVTNTGKVKYFIGSTFAVDSVHHRVIQPNPDTVHQEQDMVNW